MTEPAPLSDAALDPNYGMHLPRENWTCSACGQTTTHLRHIIVAEGAHPITGEPMSLSVERHLDCCHVAGCVDGTCGVILDHAGDKRYDDLSHHVHDNKDALKPLVDAQMLAYQQAINPPQPAEPIVGQGN